MTTVCDASRHGLCGDGAVGIHNRWTMLRRRDFPLPGLAVGDNNVRQVALAEDFAAFLTLPAYAMVD